MLKVEALESGYGTMQVLWGAELEVKKESITTVLGPNGAGKSTLLKTIFGLVRPWNGRILLNGDDITYEAPHQKVDRGLTIVLEGRHLFPSMSVRENLILGAYTDRAMRKLDDSLELVYSLFPVLRERSDQIAGTLSGGEQQMLAIARSLMSNPEIVLMDEPSQGLAPKLVMAVFETISRLREEGLTILLVEQNVFASLEISDYAYVLNEGRISLGGSIDEVRDSDEIKRVYLGL